VVRVLPSSSHSSRTPRTKSVRFSSKTRSIDSEVRCGRPLSIAAKWAENRFDSAGGTILHVNISHIKYCLIDFRGGQRQESLTIFLMEYRKNLRKRNRSSGNSHIARRIAHHAA
jgi:hypothetical protein